MAWMDDALPLRAARPLEGEEALGAALHALAALAAGIAAMQAFMAVVVGEFLPAALFTAAFAATGACAFVSDESRLRRAASRVGGTATVLVWLAVLPQAQGQTMFVLLAMAGISAFVTRRMLVGDGDSPPPAVQAPAAPPGSIGWIEDDREGRLAGT